jgi:DNA-binding GntR family transcriptional regulator
MANHKKKAMVSNKFIEINIKSSGRQPLSHQVYERLKEVIVKGELAPGTKLTETEVAKRINVSATPVREAFRRLATEGFITIEPWKGVRVQDLAEKEVIETYQCREALEGYACRLAATNMDAEGIKRLRSLLAGSKNIKSADEIVEINLALHNVILEYARNEKLTGMLGLFRNMVTHHRHVTAYIDERRKQMHKEHENIVNALDQKDAARAENEMRLHIQRAYHYYVSCQDNRSK